LAMDVQWNLRMFDDLNTQLAIKSNACTYSCMLLQKCTKMCFTVRPLKSCVKCISELADKSNSLTVSYNSIKICQIIIL